MEFEDGPFIVRAGLEDDEQRDERKDRDILYDHILGRGGYWLELDVLLEMGCGRLLLGRLML